MNLNKFYSENSVEIWKLILGPKLHYHAGSISENDIFDQSVKNLFPYIKKESKILDCGCGWGGPARLLINELKCKLTGVTISQEQANSIKDFTVYCSDLFDYIPDEKYDIALFIESFCHLNDPTKVLKNLHNNVEKIIIKDYLWEYDWYNDIWGMYMRSKSSYVDILTKNGYQIDLIEIDKTTDIYKTCEYWKNNFKLIDSKYITGQLEKLYQLINGVLSLDCEKRDLIQTVLVVARPV